MCSSDLLGAKEVGRGGALILGRRGPGPASCPAAGDRVLLSNPRLIGKPDLYGLAAGLARRDRLQTGSEGFL